MSSNAKELLALSTIFLWKGNQHYFLALFAAGISAWANNETSQEVLQQCLSGAVAGAVLVGHGNLGRRNRDKPANVRRNTRLDWKTYQDGLSDRKFRRRFKVDKSTFAALVEALRPELEPNRFFAVLSFGSAITTELRLASTLRWLAGSNFSDIEDIYFMESSTFYKRVLWQTVYALDRHLQLGSDLSDEDELARLAQGMYQRNKQTLKGCIGGLDGMALMIGRPSQRCCAKPRSYFNRKGFYAMNLQAIATHDRKFLWFSLKCTGSTHDSLAWESSSLGIRLKHNPLPWGYWIAGDDAYYMCREWLLTPYSSQSAYSERKDTWNYYQSRSRINVECAFGMLTKRFGILRRKMTSTLQHTTAAVSVCIKLHNLCVDLGHADAPKPLTCDVLEGDAMQPIQQDKCAKTLPSKKGAQSESSRLREQLATELYAAGFRRPSHSKSKLKG